MRVRGRSEEGPRRLHAPAVVHEPEREHRRELERLVLAERVAQPAVEQVVARRVHEEARAHRDDLEASTILGVHTPHVSRKSATSLCA